VAKDDPHRQSRFFAYNTAVTLAAGALQVALTAESYVRWGVVVLSLLAIVTFLFGYYFERVAGWQPKFAAKTQELAAEPRNWLVLFVTTWLLIVLSAWLSTRRAESERADRAIEEPAIRVVQIVATPTPGPRDGAPPTPHATEPPRVLRIEPSPRFVGYVLGVANQISETLAKHEIKKIDFLVTSPPENARLGGNLVSIISDACRRIKAECNFPSPPTQAVDLDAPKVPTPTRPGLVLHAPESLK
jgi:hypothetical protein